MLKCKQKITWHLKKDDLLKILDEAGPDFSALEIKMCVTSQSTIKLYAAIINADKLLTTERECCPVPPDCNKYRKV